ncbi:4Fe-4S dicluster domain-containing protein [bacterium]|nr:4Fe-4S dicluster domain-containing protein [bacterium]
MRVLRMNKRHLPEFLEASKQFGELWGPVKKGEVYVYEHIQDISEMSLQPQRTLLPLKKLIYPPKIKMFQYEGEKYQDTQEEVPRRVVYGVPSCDIHGLLIMDEIFLRQYRDPYYAIRRERTAILGASFCTCYPKSCLCQSMGTDFIKEGFDLYFTDLGNYYLVWVGSSLGDDLIRLKPEIFNDNISRKDLSEFVTRKSSYTQEPCNIIDMAIIPDLVELSSEHPVWEEMGEKCLECGACTMVCPTCNCYNVFDEPYLNTETGKRERYWDSCTFNGYSVVAGGHNFRESRAERLRLWYWHKLNSFGPQERPACVGCGRCVDTCPVDINVLTVSKRLLGDKTKQALSTKAKKP